MTDDRQFWVPAGRLGRRGCARPSSTPADEVSGVTRNGKVCANCAGPSSRRRPTRFDRAVADRRAAEGADIIFNGLNPLYTDWAEKVPADGRERHGRVPRPNGASHLLPGNVYNFGYADRRRHRRRTHPDVRRPRRADIRIAMEALFRREAEASAACSTIVLRAGDFFGGTKAPERGST